MFVTMTACGNVPNEEMQIEISEAVNNLKKTVSESDTEWSENTEGNMNTKTLVVYFSCTGTTEPLAKYAAEILGADIYEIVPEKPYTEADLAYYTDCRADREQNDPQARPAISGSVENMDNYDTIIIGYPIWHGQAPKIIYTFLESYDFSNKTIVPFCTSHSSSIGSSADNLHLLCDDSVTWLEGKRFGGDTSKNEIQKWIDYIDLN
ncbi:MAG: flavodoxin [Oscillospiraceae bacterium]|nr:flavodoxin [Oscillospiraceae bacterium]